MQPTTSQDNSQVQTPARPTAQGAFQNNSQISPDSLRSALGFITNFHEQSLPKAPQKSQNAPETTQTPETGNSEVESRVGDLEAKIDKKLEILRDELKGNQKVEVDSLKKLITDALNGEE